MTARTTSWLLGAGTLLLQLSAAAQSPVPTRLPTPGRSGATVDDSTALVKNPAGLAFLDGHELRWSAQYLDEAAVVPWQGHALAMASPFPFVPLASGLRVDFINPPESAALPDARPYQYVTWGLALGTVDTASIGVSLQRSFSESVAYDGIGSWTIGFASHPFDHAGVFAVAHDVNGPVSAGGFQVPARYEFGLALRPLGTSALEVGLEGELTDDVRDVWTPRATLGVEIPRFGELRADVQVGDVDERVGPRTWSTQIQLAMQLSGQRGTLEAAVGTVLGDELGDETEFEGYRNISTEVALKTAREPRAIRVGRFTAHLRLEGTPGTRQHVALLRKLWRLSENPTAEALYVELRAAPAESMARVEELRDAFALLRARGKKVVCHLESTRGDGLFLCSAADKIYIAPGGGVRFAGLRLQAIYFARLLEKVGIRADFVRIGAHKSAPEALTRDEPSDVAREDTWELLQEFEDVILDGIASGRGMTRELAKATVARGPFSAKEALEAKLVDGLAFEDEMADTLTGVLGRRPRLLEDWDGPESASRFGSGNRVVLLYADGDIVDGRTRTVPIFGQRMLGSYSFSETLREIRRDPRNVALVIRVESPGGSAVASDAIWREVALTAKELPVAVSMGSVAASGGYYIAAPAARIFANQSTITGSIGVFYGKADVAGLLDKVGVSVTTYKTEPHADLDSLFRPYTDDERALLQREIAAFYDLFLDRVSTGRGLDKTAVDAVGQGRVWTGRQAAENRLVDEIGGLRQALAWVRAQARAGDDLPLLEVPPPDESLLSRLTGVPGVHAGKAAKFSLPLPMPLKDVLVAVAPFLDFRGDEPLARLDWVLIP